MSTTNCTLPNGISSALSQGKRQIIYLLSRFKENESLSVTAVKNKVSVTEANKFGILRESLTTYLDTFIRLEWLSISIVRKTNRYRITTSGLSELNQLRYEFAELTYPGLLLLSLCSGERRSLTAKQIQSLSLSIARQDILKTEICSPIPKRIQNQFLEQGFIQLAEGKYAGGLRITDAGIKQLRTQELLPDWKFQLTGAILTELVKDVSHTQNIQNPKEVSNQTTTALGNLRQVIVDTFETLRREKYHRSGCVPIFEIRQFIRERFGNEVASHATLDPEIKRLRVEKEFDLIPITISSHATPEQITDSLPGIGETLFYMEKRK